MNEKKPYSPVVNAETKKLVSHALSSKLKNIQETSLIKLMLMWMNRNVEWNHYLSIYQRIYLNERSNTITREPGLPNVSLRLYFKKEELSMISF